MACWSRRSCCLAGTCFCCYCCCCRSEHCHRRCLLLLLLPAPKLASPSRDRRSLEPSPSPPPSNPPPPLPTSSLSPPPPPPSHLFLNRQPLQPRSSPQPFLLFLLAYLVLALLSPPNSPSKLLNPVLVQMPRRRVKLAKRAETILLPYPLLPASPRTHTGQPPSLQGRPCLFLEFTSSLLISNLQLRWSWEPQDKS